MVKNIYCLLKYACCALVVSLAVSELSAQEKMPERLNTPAAFENLRMQGLWLQSNNAAGALLDQSFRYATADLGYQFYNGNFRRPQQGREGNSMMFNTEGGGKLKNAYAWGSFSYSRDKVKDANFNASIADPYRGMPYYAADTNVSDWNNQHYVLKMRLASPKFWNFLSIGLDGYYKNSVVAKQRDMRTKSLVNVFNLKPGVVLSLGEKHHIGFDLEYASLREDLEMRTVNNYVDQTYYLLWGLGMATEQVGGQKYMVYNANQIGGGFQYNYQDDINLLLDLDYSKKVEDVITNPTAKKLLGTTKDYLFQGKFLLYVPDGKENTHFLQLNYRNRKIDGIEYIQKWEGDEDGGGWIVYGNNIRSTFKTQVMNLDYDYVLNRGLEYSWKLGLGVKYEKNEERYLIPLSTRELENLNFEVRAKKNFFLADKNVKRLLVNLNVGYNKNQKEGYEYGGAYPEYRIVTEFMRDDTHYLGADYCNFNLSAVYSQWINERNKANLFAKVDWRYLKTNSYDFDHRMMMCVSVGCNF